MITFDVMTEPEILITIIDSKSFVYFVTHISSRTSIFSGAEEVPTLQPEWALVFQPSAACGQALCNAI